MSVPWSTGAVRSRGSRPVPRGPRLQVVPRVQRARGSQFVVLVAGMLVGGLIGLLLLNLSMQKGAFELARLQEQTGALRTSEQALTFDLGRQESTQSLYRRAQALGMVPNSSPVFLDLTDGSIIGTPVPAPPAPEPEPEPTDSAAQTDAAADTGVREQRDDRDRDRADDLTDDQRLPGRDSGGRGGRG